MQHWPAVYPLFQTAVLQPEVVEYTLEQFQAQLKLKFDDMAGDLEKLRRRRRELEAEVERLTQALAAGGMSHPPVAIRFPGVRIRVRCSSTLTLWASGIERETSSRNHSGARDVPKSVCIG
jgi:hypothetical protein